MHGSRRMEVTMKRHQLSVPMTPELRELVELAAEREDRTGASYVRHLICERR
jgi:predicted DNA-binding protein